MTSNVPLSARTRLGTYVPRRVPSERDFRSWRRAMARACVGGFLLVGVGLSFARAELLDPFEDSLGWTDTSKDNATLSLDSPTGVTGSAFRLSYDFPDDSYVQIEKDFSLVNLLEQGANAVRFQYKAVGVANRMEVKFTDNDSTSPLTSDKFDYRLTVVPDGQWRTVTVPFPEFFSFDDGDGLFEAWETSHLAIGMVQKDVQLGSGTLWVDNVQLVRLSSYSYMLDSYETPNFNDRKKPDELGGPDSVELGGTGGSGSIAYRADDKVSGNQSLQFTYTVGNAGGPYTAFSSFFNSYPIFVPPADTNLTFYMKGQAGGESPRVELWWYGGFSSVALTDYGNVTTSFKKFSIPLTDFSGVNPGLLRGVKIVFNVPGASGQLLLDEMTLEQTGATEAVIRHLDDFTVSAKDSFWVLFPHEEAVSTLDLPFDFTTSLPSGGNRVFRIDYDFPSGAALNILYAVAERELRPNPLAERVFTFNYKGDGDASNLEFKVEDAAGTVFSRTVKNATNTGGVWRRLRVPIEELSHFSGGDQLNLREIKRIFVAVSGTGGGKGTLSLDNLSTGEGSELVTSAGRGGLIQKLTVPDNPFSPNGDGTKDEARFIADLGEGADVSLTIYNLRGVPVRRLDGGHFGSSPATIVWDGRGDDGQLVQNGLFFFRFKASSSSGTDDEVKQLIGVIR